MIIPIEHILNENGVRDIFRLVVPSGTYAGTYDIEKPDGWNDSDFVIDIDEELMFVRSFLLGETFKLKFTQFNDPEAYDLINKVYNLYGGDGRIIFKYIGEVNGVEYDILSEEHELNLNKYSTGFEKSMMSIEVELIKSEAENKLFTREDTTINLLDLKDLDDKDIAPIQTFDVGFKKGDKTLSNFYTYDQSQRNAITDVRSEQFFSFQRSSDYEFGDNTNEYAGIRNFPPFVQEDMGPFVQTNITLKKVKIEITNLRFLAQRVDNTSPNVTLFALIRNGGNTSRQIPLKNSVSYSDDGINWGDIKIENETFDIGSIQPGQNLTFMVKTNENVDFGLFSIDNNATIDITCDMESPLVKTKGIRLIEAINQVAKNYTSGKITAVSNVLGLGGYFYNTSISTGMYLRGLPPQYLLQKIKTSMKSILYDGASKLLALGFDVLNDKLVIEDLGYFFKDVKVYDLSERNYLNEGFKIDNDKDIAFNNLMFGSTKYSTKVNFDIKNFNTTSEISTPITSNKNKFDKQTNLIIDPYKIQELIEDDSKSTNDNDDDLVLIDMVEATDVWDQGVFEGCSHSIKDGKLLLKCAATPFDTTLMLPHYFIEITEGLNVGTWAIISIDGFEMLVNKPFGIQEGVNDTTIRYKIDHLIKNRSDEGFTGYDETIRNVQSTTNIRHNPKYQMARWFPFFGSGLRKKLNTDLLKVTNYKNNSDAKMTIVAPEMPNELQGNVVVGGNEELGRLREYKQTFFNGEIIEITFEYVSFREFILIYNNWKFGPDNDRTKNRGYITCNTPLGIYDVYPFGDGALSHNKNKNNLSIKGKIKGKSVDSPTLISVVQVDKNTVTLFWDYSSEYLNPVTKIQVSKDGLNWTTIKTVNNVKTDTFSSDFFHDIMTGDIVYFKVLVSTADYSNKSSNTLNIVWQFNNWVLREISRSENVNCGFSYLTLEIQGTVNLEFDWNFFSSPGGGAGNAINSNDSSNIVSFTSPYGLDYLETKTTTMSLVNETKQISIQVNNTNKTESGKFLNCTSGNATAFVTAYLEINIKDLSTTDVITKVIGADTIKKYILRPTDPIGPIETP